MKQHPSKNWPVQNVGLKGSLVIKGLKAVSRSKYFQDRVLSLRRESTLFNSLFKFRQYFYISYGIYHKWTNFPSMEGKCFNWFSCTGEQKF